MAQSTEDYLDSLLRQAMGIPDPEPVAKPDVTPDLAREDVLAMADGLTGSNSAILGNAYDHNASFTNQGEIEIHTATPKTEPQQPSSAPTAVQAPVIAPENMPDPDAPVAVSTTPEVSAEAPVASSVVPDTSMFTENLLPDIEETPAPAPAPEPEPAIVPEAVQSAESIAIPEGPVIEHDTNTLDLIHGAPLESIPDLLEEPVIPEPAAEPEIPTVDETAVEIPDIPVVEETAIEIPDIPEPVAEPEIPVAEEPSVEIPAEEPAPAVEEAAPSISIDDLDPNDASKALDADMIAALFASANAEEPAAEEAVAEEPAPAVEEPVIEEPVAEEPVAESEIPAPEIPVEAAEEPAPAVEEPVVEEPVPEEPIAEPEIPVAEEPVAEPEIPAPEIPMEETEEPAPAVEEAAPAISIDDLDPNDASKALDADTIAALFASANADEGITEEPAAEDEASSISIDDLDPNDANKALDADTIAALFASANAEEAPVEEPAAEEEAPADAEPPVDEDNLTPDQIAALLSGEEAPAEEQTDIAADDDTPLEALDIQLDDVDETPLMPDEEISDLLSTLGELTGEGGEETAEEAAEDTEKASEGDAAPEAEVGGLDLFDTDLSAMLDDVTNSLDSEGAGDGAQSSDDADLNDLLGSLDDGSGDLSDIGNLLDKDENSELVDPNTETAEALFASDSEDELFDIDNLIEEEEPKRKKKKKFSLFGKKKKKSDNIEVIGESEEEMLVDPDLLDIPDESELKKKKQGFFATLLAKLFEEVDEGEDESVSGIEQSAVDIAQEGAAENEAILSELEGEEGGKDKKKKKEKKKKEKKEKKGKKGGDSESEDGEEAAEDTKKKKKKEKKKKEKDLLPDIPTKKLPRKKVVAISLFCITIGIVITILAFFIPYSQDIEKAKKFYTTGEYQKTYEYMRGHKLTAEDQLLYDRTTTLLRIKRPYDSYQNYMKMGLRIEALNALVQGVQMVDRYAEDAATLGIIDKYSKLSRMIYDELYNTFGVTVEKARGWIELEGTPEYTRALYECLVGTSGISAAEPDAGEAPDDSDLPFDMTVQDDSVINAEENDL